MMVFIAGICVAVLVFVMVMYLAMTDDDRR